MTSSDLDELLRERAVENVRLEFKRDVPLREETLKKLSSFANTQGGLLVVGAEAPSADGRLQALPGVATQPNYKHQLIQWCYDGVWPPLEPLVSPPIPVTADPTRVCYVIEVPVSLEAPHFINGRKGVYVRTNEFSQRFEPHLANYDELEHLRRRRELVIGRREALVVRAHERFERYVADYHADAPGSDGHPGAMVFLSILPQFPDRVAAEGKRLVEVVDRVRVSWRQTGFPRPSRRVTQFESVLAFNPAVSFSLFEATEYGTLHYSREIEEEREVEEGQGAPHSIHLASFVGHLLVWLEHGSRVLLAIEHQGPLVIRLRLSGIRGLEFLDYPNNRPVPRAVSVLDDDVTVEIEVASRRLHEERDALIKELCAQLFFATNWPEAASDDGALEQLLQRGYAFNFWTGARGERIAPR